MSFSSTLEKIAADRERYSCQVETLGDCRIGSPLVRHWFVKEEKRTRWLSRLGSNQD